MVNGTPGIRVSHNMLISGGGGRNDSSSVVGGHVGNSKQRWRL